MIKVDNYIISFIDASGFAKYCETQKPDFIFGKMSSYFKISEKIINNYNGKIIKYLGDGILLIFDKMYTSKINEILNKIKIELEEWFIKNFYQTEITIKSHAGEIAIGEIKFGNYSYTEIFGSNVNKTFLLKGRGIIFSDELNEMINNI